jgi:DNA repair exonuclease SbcCD ATPase subunit
MCLFSIIEIQETLGGASFNVLLLDEIFAALDEEGRNGLFDILDYLKGKGKCIYTISHTPIANPVVFDSTIQVIKENGLSRLS